MSETLFRFEVKNKLTVSNPGKVTNSVKWNLTQSPWVDSNKTLSENQLALEIYKTKLL